jgi:hypothetical protein
MIGKPLAWNAMGSDRLKKFSVLELSDNCASAVHSFL